LKATRVGLDFLTRPREVHESLTTTSQRQALNRAARASRDSRSEADVESESSVPALLEPTTIAQASSTTVLAIVSYEKHLLDTS